MVLECALRDELSLPLFIPYAGSKRWEETEVAIHGLKTTWIRRGDVGEQTAVSRRRRRCDQRQPRERPRRVDPGYPSHCRRIRVSLHADQLPGKEQRVTGFELERVAQQLWRIDERIAVKTPKPEKLRLFETGNH